MKNKIILIRKSFTWIQEILQFPVFTEFLENIKEKDLKDFCKIYKNTDLKISIQKYINVRKASNALIETLSISCDIINWNQKLLWKTI